MKERDDELRDFGVWPVEHLASAGTVRSQLKWHNVIFQIAMSVIMIGGFFAVGVVIVVIGLKNWESNGVSMLCFSVLFFVMVPFMVFHVGDTKLWVELDGEIIRARNLYTFRITERSVGEIEEVATQVYLLRSDHRTTITEAFLGRVRGFAIRFPDDRRGIRIFRPEMTNVRELIEAVIARMARRGKVVPEIMDFEGRPMIKRVVWEKDLSKKS